jgi:hypothetical protein
MARKRWKQLERKEGQTRTWVLDNKATEMQHVMHEQMYELFFERYKCVNLHAYVCNMLDARLPRF